MLSTVEAESKKYTPAKEATPVITDFSKSMISGFRSRLQQTSDLKPACFCQKSGVCKKHTLFEPTLETMIDLLDTQVQDINADEKRLDDNLDFVARSMESVLITRKDTFKSQITKAYADKEDELTEYKQLVADMEERD